ncbi:MAG: PEP-CTERM sorting domain-containing protein [Phycisphaerae bacterium]|nr:PEP-CTERM sorting domain-containing protein [Phycisphaerae bacterium]
MSKRFLIAAAIGLWVAVTPAAGTIITATFLGVNPGRTIRVYDGSTSPALSRYVSAGVYNFRIQPGTTYTGLGAVGDTFGAFCIDLGNTIARNHTYTWSVVDPSDSPNPSTYSDGHISASEMLALQRLIGAYPLSSLSTRAQAAAFQAALWEIVNESGSVYYVTVGNFRASRYLDTALANQMLTVSAGYQGALPLLKALTSPCAQDMLVVIPEPATLSLLSAGMGILALHRRHVRR